ncbi:MAG: phage terminase large subunit, partial [Planctomycetota bacterium]
EDAMSKVRREGSIEWFESTLSSRLDDKTEDAMVLIQQRLHMDDLAGHLLRTSSEWTHLNLPAVAVEHQVIPLGSGRSHERVPGDLLHPAREPQWVLDDLRTSMGSQKFSAQYQQAPFPPEGALVKRRWLQQYTKLPESESYDRIIQSWDTASRANETNDYSVCTTWLKHGRDYYLLDVDRDRLEYPDLKRRVVELSDRWKAQTVLIEDASSGTHLIQDLQMNGPIRPIAIRPDRDKIVRLEAQTGIIEAGYVRLPESAAWLEDFENELLSFPHGHFDDQVDSFSQFLNWAETESWRSEFEIAGF